jgi:dUTPase
MSGYLIANMDPIIIKKGEKVAQLIMNPYSPHYFLQQIEKVDIDTDRGEGGFGSTGKA